MASTFIDSTTAKQIIGTMFDNLSVKPLRPDYVFDALSKERLWNLGTVPKKGDTITFVTFDALAFNTAPLDPTADTISGGKTLTHTRRSVTLQLFGDHSAVDTLGLVPETFVDVMSDASFNIADQAMNSINRVARAAWDLNKFSNEISGALSNTFHLFGSQGTVGSIGPLKAVDVRRIFADLRADNVKPFADGLYRFIVHPRQSQQLRAETGDAAWRAPRIRTGELNRDILTGEIGEFEGFMFVANNEVAGAAGGVITNTLSGYAVGMEAVGKAVGMDVRIGLNPTFRGTHENIALLTWDALINYKIIRREALRIIETTSTRL